MEARWHLTGEYFESCNCESRFRDHGRNWNFTAQSAEYGRFDWSGP